MKKAIIIVIVVAVLAILAAYLFGPLGRTDRAPEVPAEAGADEVLSGTVASVDASGVAADGPYLIEVADENGAISTVAVPSMGILLCRTDRIADIAALEAGTEVRVRGSADDEGRIVPCISENHYLEIAPAGQE